MTRSKSPMPAEIPDDISLDKVVARERDLIRRKDELARREQDVSLALQRTMPNFPPKFLCIRPLVYHSIVSEVPSDRVRYVKIAYFMFYFTVCTLLYNAVCAVVGAVATDTGDSDHGWGAHVGTSVIYLLGIPGSFVVWYYPLYTAASTGDGYGMTFIGCAVGLVFSLFAFVGVISYGACGVLYTLALFMSKEGVAPYMSLVCTVLWGVQVLFFCGAFVVMRWLRREDAVRERDASAAVARSTLGQVPQPGAKA